MSKQPPDETDTPGHESHPVKADTENSEAPEDMDANVDPDEGWVDKRTCCRQRSEFALLCLCNIAWTIDSSVLPIFYKEFQDRFGASQTSLAALNTAKGFTAALFAFPSGFAAELLPRPQLIGLGMLFWAFGLVLCASAWSFEVLFAARVLNGMGLGIVQPLLCSLVADSHAPTKRGMAFGSLFFVGSVCNTLFGFVATTFAVSSVAGIAGWRVSVGSVAVFSGLVGIVVMLAVREPNAMQHVSRPRQSFMSMFRTNMPKVAQLFRYQTFVLILCQGAPGTAPWTVFPFFTEWLELSCFTHSQTALIFSTFGWGTACSSLLSGCLLNFVARRFPDHGPPTIANFSVASGIPFLLLVFFILPSPLALGAAVKEIPIYCMTFLAFGLGAHMCGTVNKKVFADIVPPSIYSYVFAVDQLIENSFGSFAGLAVGVVTDRVFKYDRHAVHAGDCAPEEAKKLGMGMFVVCTVAWAICFSVYLGLHCTYPKDRRRQLKLRRMEGLRSKASANEVEDAEEEQAEISRLQCQVQGNICAAE